MTTAWLEMAAVYGGMEGVGLGVGEGVSEGSRGVARKRSGPLPSIIAERVVGHCPVVTPLSSASQSAAVERVDEHRPTSHIHRPCGHD